MKALKHLNVHQPQLTPNTLFALNSIRPMKVNGTLIPCRASDNFYSATAIEDATGKSFAACVKDPHILELLREHQAKSSKNGSSDWRALIHTAGTKTSAKNWVDPAVAIVFAIWASDPFAMMVHLFCLTVSIQPSWMAPGS